MFLTFCTKGNNFVTSCFLPYMKKISKRGLSTLKGNNLLPHLGEQIISFKSCPPYICIKKA